MKKKETILVSGHHGAGTGANGYLDEGAEAIWLKNKIDHYLFFNYGINAILDKDRMSLRGVISSIKKMLKLNKVDEDDLCLSIHFNASTNEKANGTSVYIPTFHTEAEKHFAEKLSAGVSYYLQGKNRGVKLESQSHYGKLAILSGFDMKNILLEVCFVTNKQDAGHYQANKDSIAIFIADCIYKHHILGQ